LPGAVAVAGIEAEIGQTPNGFPWNRSEVMEMTQVQLNQLAVFYNEDFGILAGDSEAERLDKFLDWILYG